MPKKQLFEEKQEWFVQPDYDVAKNYWKYIVETIKSTIE